jgi:mannose/fructose-specific phosphotransferase system component IIA
MSEGVLGIVVSHGSLAQALVNAVGRITGPDTGLVPVSNDGCSTGSLGDRIRAVTRDGPCILFIDMPGGSCFMAAAKCLRERSDVGIVSGVNLPMLLDFVHHRDQDVSTIVRRLVDVGARAIRTIPT